jgi:hypothetical protein
VIQSNERPDNLFFGSVFFFAKYAEKNLPKKIGRSPKTSGQKGRGLGGGNFCPLVFFFRAFGADWGRFFNSAFGGIKNKIWGGLSSGLWPDAFLLIPPLAGYLFSFFLASA